ncbi:unnamed protein product, partial [Rotaria sp. Silwood1]
VDCSSISCGKGQFLCSHDYHCINATEQYDDIASMR